MPGESAQNFFSNPFWIIIALIAIAGLICIAAFFFLRSRRNASHNEEHLQSQLLEMEHENQFAVAVEHLPYFKDAAAASKEIASLFREYLSMPVLAIYAGREGEPKHSNILAKGSNSFERQTDSLLLRSMPASIASSSVTRYWGPQVEKLSALSGGIPVATGYEQSLAADSQSGAGGFDTGPLDDLSQRNSESESFGRDMNMVSQELDVVVFPWRGPFDWHGLIITRPVGGVNPEQFGRLRESLTRVSDRISVALQFQYDISQMAALDERATRTMNFSYALFSCLEDPSPLSSIAREVTNLVQADSGALWRVEPGSSMVRMVAAHGLKSAEFLPLPMGQGLAGSVAQTADSLALEDAPSDPRCIFPREARESGIRSYLGAPIFSDGKTVGVVEVHTADSRLWTETDLRSLKSAALIIAEIFKSSETRGNRLRVENSYLGLSESLQRLRAPDELMEAVVEVLGHALGVSRALVVQIDGNGQPLPVSKEYLAEGTKPALRAIFPTDMVGRLAQSAEGGPVMIADSSKDSLIGAEKAAELQILSELAVPVKLEGQTRAILYLHQCDRTREWHRDEIEFSERVARQLSLSLSNLRSFEAVSRSAQAAREEARRTGGDAATRLRDLEQKVADLERAASEARNSETQARALLAKASAAEAKARAETEVCRRSESELKHEKDRMHENYSRIEASAQQLLEINRLKSEFIVNAGREIEGALQTVLGLAELMQRGSYGSMNAEQSDAIRGIYASAKRIKGDVDWLIEYGSSRSRRLEEGESA